MANAALNPTSPSRNFDRIDFRSHVVSTPPSQEPSAPVTTVARIDDTVEVQAIESTVVSPLNTAFSNLEPLSRTRLLAFCMSHADQLPAAITRSGGDFIIMVDGAEPVRAAGADLVKLLCDEDIPSDGKLIGALRVYEAALDSRLSPAVARSIYAGYCRATATPQEAMTSAFLNISVASQVWAYHSHPQGLAQDRKELAAIAARAQTNWGGEDASTISLRTTCASIAQQQDAFASAVAEAGRTGDYCRANDILQGLLKDCDSLTGSSYWQGRSTVRSQVLALPDAAYISGGYETGGLALAASEKSYSAASSAQRTRALAKPIENPANQYYDGFTSADLRQTALERKDGPVFSFAIDQVGENWDQFREFAVQLHAKWQESGREKVYLNLDVHGEPHGFGTNGADGSRSIASAAFINRALYDAGFRPGQVTIVTDACNGAESYLNTRQGLSPENPTTGLANTTADVSGPPTGKTWADVDFEWVGRARRLNANSTVLAQLVSGQVVEGAYVRFREGFDDDHRLQLDDISVSGDKQRLADFHDLAGSSHDKDNLSNYATPAQMLNGGLYWDKSGSQIVSFNNVTKSDASYSQFGTVMSRETTVRHLEKTWNQVGELAPKDTINVFGVKGSTTSVTPVSGRRALLTTMSTPAPEAVTTKTIPLSTAGTIDGLSGWYGGVPETDLARSIRSRMSSATAQDYINVYDNLRTQVLIDAHAKEVNGEMLSSEETEMVTYWNASSDFMETPSIRRVLTMTGGDRDALYDMLKGGLYADQYRGTFATLGGNPIGGQTTSMAVGTTSDNRYLKAEVTLTDLPASQVQALREKLPYTGSEPVSQTGRFTVTLTLKPEKALEILNTTHYQHDRIGESLKKSWHSGGGALLALENYTITDLTRH